jgi:hypothetical protein
MSGAHPCHENEPASADDSEHREIGEIRRDISEQIRRRRAGAGSGRLRLRAREKYVVPVEKLRSPGLGSAFGKQVERRYLVNTTLRQSASSDAERKKLLAGD